MQLPASLSRKSMENLAEFEVKNKEQPTDNQTVTKVKETVSEKQASEKKSQETVADALVEQTTTTPAPATAKQEPVLASESKVKNEKAADHKSGKTVDQNIGETADNATAKKAAVNESVSPAPKSGKNAPARAHTLPVNATSAEDEALEHDEFATPFAEDTIRKHIKSRGLVPVKVPFAEDKAHPAPGTVSRPARSSRAKSGSYGSAPRFQSGAQSSPYAENVRLASMSHQRQSSHTSQPVHSSRFEAPVPMAGVIGPSHIAQIPNPAYPPGSVHYVNAPMMPHYTYPPMMGPGPMYHGHMPYGPPLGPMQHFMGAPGMQPISEMANSHYMPTLGMGPRPSGRYEWQHPPGPDRPPQLYNPYGAADPGFATIPRTKKGRNSFSNDNRARKRSSGSYGRGEYGHHSLRGQSQLPSVSAASGSGGPIERGAEHPLLLNRSSTDKSTEPFPPFEPASSHPPHFHYPPVDQAIIHDPELGCGPQWIGPKCDFVTDLWICEIAADTTAEQLETQFQETTGITPVKVALAKDKRGETIAYAKFASTKEAATALGASGSLLQERTMTVQVPRRYYRPSNPPSRRQSHRLSFQSSQQWEGSPWNTSPASHMATPLEASKGNERLIAGDGHRPSQSRSYSLARRMSLIGDEQRQGATKFSPQDARSRLASSSSANQPEGSGSPGTKKSKRYNALKKGRGDQKSVASSTHSGGSVSRASTIPSHATPATDDSKKTQPSQETTSAPTLPKDHAEPMIARDQKRNDDALAMPLPASSAAKTGMVAKAPVATQQSKHISQGGKPEAAREVQKPTIARSRTSATDTGQTDTLPTVTEPPSSSGVGRGLRKQNLSVGSSKTATDSPEAPKEPESPPKSGAPTAQKSKQAVTITAEIPTATTKQSSIATAEKASAQQLGSPTTEESSSTKPKTSCATRATPPLTAATESPIVPKPASPPATKDKSPSAARPKPLAATTERPLMERVVSPPTEKSGETLISEPGAPAPKIRAEMSSVESVKPPAKQAGTAQVTHSPAKGAADAAAPKEILPQDDTPPKTPLSTTQARGQVAEAESPKDIKEPSDGKTAEPAHQTQKSVGAVEKKPGAKQTESLHPFAKAKQQKKQEKKAAAKKKKQEKNAHGSKSATAGIVEAASEPTSATTAEAATPTKRMSDIEAQGICEGASESDLNSAVTADEGLGSGTPTPKDLTSKEVSTMNKAASNVAQKDEIPSSKPISSPASTGSGGEQTIGLTSKAADKPAEAKSVSHAVASKSSADIDPRAKDTKTAQSANANFKPVIPVPEKIAKAGEASSTTAYAQSKPKPWRAAVAVPTLKIPRGRHLAAQSPVASPKDSSPDQTPLTEPTGPTEVKQECVQSAPMEDQSRASSINAGLPQPSGDSTDHESQGARSPTPKPSSEQAAHEAPVSEPVAPPKSRAKKRNKKKSKKKTAEPNEVSQSSGLAVQLEVDGETIRISMEDFFKLATEKVVAQCFAAKEDNLRKKMDMILDYLETLDGKKAKRSTQASQGENVQASNQCPNTASSAATSAAAHGSDDGSQQTDHAAQQQAFRNLLAMVDEAQRSGPETRPLVQLDDYWKVHASPSVPPSSNQAQDEAGKRPEGDKARRERECQSQQDEPFQGTIMQVIKRADGSRVLLQIDAYEE